LTCLAIAACGSDDSDSPADEPRAEQPTARTSTEADPPAAPARRRRGARVKVGDSQFGRILVAGNGRTLYLFTHDEGANRSRCYGACADAWPPLYTRGRPRAGAGVARAKLGTTRRRNGRRQVTYNGHPLYYYVGEDEAGEVLCQAVSEFGGIWYVVAPAGDAVT
jgi:predicted lipoprotein with Yx(FWY)xxD motif